MSGSSGHPESDSRILIIDSWPVMEWLKRRQPTAGIFKAILERASSSGPELMMSNINLGEVYYNCWNEWGEARANEVVSLLRRLPIQMVHPTSSEILEAARIKSIYRCSYADGFAAVLGIAFDGSVLTGNPDFVKLRQGRAVEVEWLGA